MPITCNNPAVTPAGLATFTRAIRLAWGAGDLDDTAVRELTQLALARNAITPADVA